MWIHQLDQIGQCVPFLGKLVGSHPFQELQWGRCKPPVRIRLHNNHPPELLHASADRWRVKQAYVTWRNRNFLLAGKYTKNTDSDHLIAFTAHLPQGFRGKPAFVNHDTRRIFCDQSRPWQQSNFAVEGLILLRCIPGEIAIINNASPAGDPCHYRILACPGGKVPRVAKMPGFLLNPEYLTS